MGLGLSHFVPLIVYVVFWGMCLASLLGKPLYGFYYSIPFLPYRTLRDHLAAYPLGGNLLSLLILCVIVGALLAGKRLPKSKLYVLWLVFGAYLYVSMWFGALMGHAALPITSDEVTFATWKGYMLIPLLLVAASLVIEDRKAVRTTILLVAISVLIIDRSALMDSMSRTWTHFDESKRDGGPLGFAGANGLAAFLAQFSLFFWGFAQYLKRKKVRLLCYGLVALTTFATMYSFSRAAYIAVVLGALLLAVIKQRKLIPVIAVFLLTWQTVVPRAVTERVTMTKSSDGQLEASAQERVSLWTAAENSILSDPIFGTGYASYQLDSHTDGLRDTHNWYVKVMVETGIIGMILALAIVQQLWVTGYRLFRQAEDPMYKGLGLGMILCVAAAIVLNCFGDRWTYIEINGLLWVLTAASIRALSLKEVVPSAEHVGAGAAVPVNPYLAYR